MNSITTNLLDKDTWTKSIYRMEKKSRRWCFTVWKDYCVDLYSILHDLYEKKSILYYVFQVEKCPETSRLHYQGYCELSKVQRMSWLKKNIGDKHHYLIPNGDAMSNVNYCTKESSRVEDPISEGEYKVTQSGKRNDIMSFVNSIKEGTSRLDLLELYPNQYLRYEKMVDHIKSLQAPPRQIPEVIVVYGPPGCGKSTFVDQIIAPNAYWKAPPPDPVYWTDYDNQESVVFDEFKGWLPYSFLLRLCDKFPLVIPKKFGGASANFIKKIVFLSNYHPKEWYNFREEKYNALFRRITKIIKFVSLGKYITEHAVSQEKKVDQTQTFEEVYEILSPTSL